MARTPEPSRPATGRNAPGRGPSAKGGRGGPGGKAQSKAVRQAQKSSSGGRNWGLVAGVFALVLFVVGVLAFAVQNAGSESASSQQEQAANELDVQEFDLAEDASNHVQTPVDYPQTPPAGGPHNPVWQNCGVYEAPIASENAVHSLEHGAVWITYDPSLPTEQVQRLQDLAGGNDYVMVSPFEGLDAGAVYASAWGVQLQTDGVDDPRLQQFITAYQQGPQTPEPGAACSGGTGNPVA